MRRTIFLLVLSVISVISFQPIQAEDREPAGSVEITSIDLVTVKNIDPVSNLDTTFRFDDKCLIQKGGIITEIGRENSMLLVRYTSREPQSGSYCPSGVIFFLSEQDFELMEEKCARVKQRRAKEKDLIRKMLDLSP